MPPPDLLTYADAARRLDPTAALRLTARSIRKKEVQ